MKFGCFTDSHFSFKNDSRLDNTLETTCKKLKQALNWFKKQKCDFVVCMGDIFDRHRELNFDLMEKFFNIIKNQTLKIYYIAGNHDERGYRWQTIDQSTLGFMNKLIQNKLIFIQDKLEVKGCNLYACHAGQDIKLISNNIKKNEKPNILLAHCLLSDNNIKGNISLNIIENKNIDLVLSGDLHEGYKYQENKYGIKCYNPGSMVRLSKNDKNRLPKVAIFDIGQILGQRHINIQEKILKHEEGNKVFPEDKEDVVEVKKELEQSKGTYIQKFKQFRSNSKDIYQILEKTGKDRGIEQEVLDMIKGYKDINE